VRWCRAVSRSGRAGRSIARRAEANFIQRHTFNGDDRPILGGTSLCNMQYAILIRHLLTSGSRFTAPSPLGRILL
jgi:hypothetical protein